MPIFGYKSKKQKKRTIKQDINRVISLLYIMLHHTFNQTPEREHLSY